MHRRTFLKLAGSTSSRIELALAAVFAACALAPGALADEPVALREADLMGIWKMCYEPGIPGVYEPSTG